MWQAKFNDGTIIEEINNKNEIVSFNNVLKDKEKLKTLSIINGTKMYSVNMIDGKFEITTSGISSQFYAVNFDTLMFKKIENIRPIYFVRETVDFEEGQPNRGVNKRIDFTALGFQGNIGDTNIKRYLAILPDGTFTIEDK